MDDKLYLIDIDCTDNFSKEFYDFFANFVEEQQVAVLTSQPASNLYEHIVKRATYIFSANGNEIYKGGKLLYKNVISFNAETHRWVDSLNLPQSRTIDAIHVSVDPYASANLVRQYNELQTEYRAQSCAGGFCIIHPADYRLPINAIIPDSYRIRFVAPTRTYGSTNYALALAISKRGSCFNADSEASLRELLLYLSEK
jgi:hypothetical protein